MTKEQILARIDVLLNQAAGRGPEELLNGALTLMIAVYGKESQQVNTLLKRTADVASQGGQPSGVASVRDCSISSELSEPCAPCSVGHHRPVQRLRRPGLRGGIATEALQLDRLWPEADGYWRMVPVLAANLETKEPVNGRYNWGQ